MENNHIPHLIVMIPAFNEEKTIGKVIEEIPKKIPGIKKIEILVIDDGSEDKRPVPISQLQARGGAYADTLSDISLSITVGIVVAAYSTLFVAAPLYSLFREGEPQLRERDERVRAARELAAVDS